MADVIKILIHEHDLILKTLDELRNLEEGCPNRDLLERFEKLLVDHVSKEDSEIYIPLRKLAALSTEADVFLTRHRRELEEVKISTLIFFEKFRGQTSALLCERFQEDLEKLSAKVRHRVNLEDKELFPFLSNFWKTIK